MPRHSSWNIFSRFSDVSIDTNFAFPSLFDADRGLRAMFAAGGELPQPLERLSGERGGALTVTEKPDLTTASLPAKVNYVPTPQSPAEIALAAAVTDPDIAGDTGTTTTIDVDGSRVISTINTPGDQDWIRVDLQAGVTYEIGLYATRQGPSGVPLFDGLVEIRDANGNFLRMDDSGGPPSPYQTDDALLIFTPETSGTYYINARAWDARDPSGLTGSDINPLTTTGDFVGDYEAFVRVSHLEPDYYRLRTETEDDPTTARDEIGMPTLDSSPLHSLDWGTQFDGTSRNPDGAEGPRVTGNEVESKIGGKNVIYFYYAREGELFVDNAANPLNLTTTIVAKGFSEWEKNAIELGLDRYENVADVVYVETDDRFAADIVFVTYNGTPGIATPSLAGRMSPPDTASEGQTEYNAGDYRWTPEGLAPGGVFFGTLIHELGHGHGMSHPHDDGGRSSIMRGVEEVETFVYTLGDFGLNQGVYSMMSYQDGWQESPYGQPANDLGYGFIGSLMAFDVAVIQDKYGVNEEYATGDDTYVLPDENSAATFDAAGNMTKEGTSWKCIWDAGGTDSLVYDGSKDANIDLRAATLKYEEGGGGRVSYAWGVHGGWTIANSVVIENARSGSGNDTLTGNDAANTLSAGAGDDKLDGGAGDDTLIGGLGSDRLTGGAGSDTFGYASASDSVAGAGRDVIAGFEQGSDRIDLSAIGGSLFIGSNAFSGAAGQVRYAAFAGTTIVELDADGDRVADFQLELDDNVALRFDDFTGLADGTDPLAGDNVLSGTWGADVLDGRAGDDALYGLGGSDRLIGGAGADRMTGGSGADTFVYNSASDSSVAASDMIMDFTRRSDRIDLSALDANAGTAANDAFSFIGAAAFTGQAGQLRAFSGNGGTTIQGDLDGDLMPDFQILLDDRMVLAAGDFVL